MACDCNQMIMGTVMKITPRTPRAKRSQSFRRASQKTPTLNNTLVVKMLSLYRGLPMNTSWMK